MTTLCQHPEGCLAWTEGNTEYCATHNAQERKRLRDEAKAKEKEKKTRRTAEKMRERAAEKAKERTPKKEPYYIPPVSKKRAKQLRVYGRTVKEWKEDKHCVRCGSPRIDCHHMEGKENEKLLEQDKWLPLCRNCHTWATINSREAIREGYSLPRNH